MTTVTEAHVEDGGIAWLTGSGWCITHGPDFAPDTPRAERADYSQVVLEPRLRDPLAAQLGARLPTLVAEKMRIGDILCEAST